LRILLSRHGVTAKFDVPWVAAGDLATALELADRHPFDLLISDLGLPDGSGHD